jgi:hypothetical protein
LTSNIPNQKKIGETEYGIGWLPLGGVKISGMIDEAWTRNKWLCHLSLGNSDLNKPINV